MREVNLRNVDLNLLHALRALLEERHVTRAAKRCFLSQPAMSRALERLREMFADALLVRSGRTYERTARGERVLRELESLMPRLEALVRGQPFEPALSQERFRLALTDHASAVLMPPLWQSVRAAAANVTLEVSAWHSRAYEDVVAGRLDLALSAEVAPSFLEAEVLYQEDFVCLVGSAQRVGRRRFTLKQYLDLPHAVVETWDGQQTPVDRPLAALRPAYPLLCADAPRHCSHRPDPHAAPQIGKDYNVDGRPPFGRASPRDQGVFLFYGVASAAHERTRARMVSRTGEDGCAHPLRGLNCERWRRFKSPTTSDGRERRCLTLGSWIQDTSCADRRRGGTGRTSHGARRTVQPHALKRIPVETCERMEVCSI